MSVSTPRPINSSPDLATLLHQNRLRSRIAWSLSALMHAGLFAAFLSLGRNAPLPAISAEPTRASLAGRIESETRLQVAELRKTEKELTATRDRRQAQYNAWVQERLASAPTRTRQALQQALQAQKQADAAQAEVVRLHQQMAQIPKITADAVIPLANRALNRMEAARTAQAEAAQAQNEALSNLQLMSSGDPQLTQAITAAQQKQAQAQEAQKKALEMQAQIAQMQPKARDGFVEAEKLKKVFEAVKNDPQAGPKALTHYNQVGSDAMAMWANLKKLRETVPATQAAAQQAQAEAEQAQGKALAQLPHPRPLSASERGDHRNSPPLMQHGEEKGNHAAIASQKKSPSDASPLRIGEGTEVRSTHKGGQENGPEGGNGGSGFLGSRDKGADSSGTGLEGRSLPELYAEAVASEQRGAEAYRQIHAIDRAMIEGIPLDRAMQETEYAPPLRPALHSSRASGIMDLLTGSNSHENESETAQQQIASMNALGHRLLDRVQAEHNDREGATIRQEWVQGQAARQSRLHSLAQEDTGQQAKDLTAFMRGLPGGTTGNARSTGEKPQDIRPAPASLPPPIPAGVDIKAIAGRRVQPGASSSAWMFVDSWYTIGPFPNPNRANINKSFPPEQGIDLDAAYTGKDNRTLRWKFVQSGGPMVVPADAEEYGVYYAYTELRFDQPRDLWIAVGSDDKSTIWIEDQLVWVSSDVLKGWRIDEGLRKVHFKKGINRIVYRLENGWRGMGMSLVICLKSSP